MTLNQSLMSGVVLCLTNSVLPNQQKAIRLFEATPHPPRWRGFQCVLPDRLECPHSVVRAARV